MDKKIKILLLDDEPIVLERVKSSLELSGYNVDSFISSKDAIDKLKQVKYDILITDLKMSSPDGMEVLKTAKQIQPEIKAIVITGFATKQTAEFAKKIGAIEFIPKPFKMSQLKNILNVIAGAEDK
ncbi:MAG: response regulator [Ignavibacteriaceae bacterium]|jgi:DNA-binding NtrC family response regulator|nr:response regulator [Ignavibacteriaceae bacterium]MCW8814252.1 response regulator [Chlorobium sp.]MCW8994434.1 response regulator [Psychromonas sp.]MCW9095768.1 response regulator [Ignavibacteriaceae bacterium]